MGMWRTTAAALLLAPAVAHALTFAVTGTADEEDLTPGNAICASATGTCTLRAALQEANELVGIDVITVPAGTYVLSLEGEGENDGLTGDLDVRDDVDIQGAGRDSVVIDAAGNDRVFHVHPEVGLTISGVTIRNGVAPDGGGGIRHDGDAGLVVRDARFDANTANDGAGILHVDDALTVTNTIFSGNVATNVGGGIAKYDGTEDVTGCEFTDNVGLSAGGGIYHGGTGNIAVAGSTFRDHYGNAGGCVYVNTDVGALTLTGTTFERCFASAGAPGGGVYYNSDTGGVTVTDGAFDGGVAVVGAGLYANTTAGVSVSGTAFTDNLASSGGGGIYRSGGGTTTVQGARFEANRGGNGQGGGASLLAAGDVTVSGSEFTANQANGGAGLWVATEAGVGVVASRFVDQLSTGGPGGAGLGAVAGVGIMLSDSTFIGNTTINTPGGGATLTAPIFIAVERTTFADNAAQGPGGYGGGLAATSGNFSITNATFSDGFAGADGGGLYAFSPTVVSSSTFAANRALGDGSAIYNAATVSLRGTVLAASSGAASCAGNAFTSAGDNVDQDASCALAGPRDRSNVDPQLGPLQDNGGGLPTHAPVQGSPLIDSDGGSCPAIDARNVARPVDGNGDGVPTCDVGAVEFLDECPADPVKVLPGICGCGVADADANANGAVDCLLNAEMKARIAGVRGQVGQITGGKDDAQKQLKVAVLAAADDLVAFTNANAGGLVLADPTADLAKLVRKARLAVKKSLRGKGKKLQKKQTKATAALDALDAAVAAQ